MWVSEWVSNTFFSVAQWSHGKLWLSQLCCGMCQVQHKLCRNNSNFNFFWPKGVSEHYRFWRLVVIPIQYLHITLEVIRPSFSQLALGHLDTRTQQYLTSLKQEEVIIRALCKKFVWTMDYRHRGLLLDQQSDIDYC